MISNARALEWATRIGFAARGLMYGLIGYLALRSGRTEDGSGIFRYLESGSGPILLLIMTLGFFAYGLWRLLDAWSGASGQGGDAKGIALRAAAAMSGILHLGLGAVAAKAAAGAAGGGDSAEQGARTALALPGGEIVIFLAAAVLTATG
ncbi:MAG TPA: DUF1206 domain-containing protein, partial [Allosphingosinicella sp.]